jgi:hypothetical protein
MFDNRVMNTVQAAEALHRARFNSEEKPIETHEKRVEAVLQAAPQAYKNWLERKLRFSNEVDLGRRLRELYGHVQGVASRLAPDREGFIQQLVKARNHLAHRGSFPPGTDVARLHHAVETLKYIMRACLVRELGFDDTETAHLFQQNSRYQNEVLVGQAPLRAANSETRALGWAANGH